MPNNDFTLNKTLIFDIKGPMAHFRKYYTNSSSLSYLFPPRTVVIGLIAGLLGIPSEKHTKVMEDTYYEKFSEKRCFVTISLRTKIKRIMQTVNYLATDNFPKTPYKLLLKMIAGEIGPTQIPLEILVPENNGEIIYRIYFYHTDSKMYAELRNRLEAKKYIFPPYMGITEFLASIDYIDEGKVSKNPNWEVKLNSVCKLKEVELCFTGEDLQYIAEKMPTGFSNDRTPKEPCVYVCEIKSKVTNIKLKDNISCYFVTYSEGGRQLIENILFM